MGKALYRKYRSKSLDEIVGQEHITQTLSRALKQGNISHAYLFTGPRGVGKTSVARILAHAVNDLQYDESITHIDIIEIDAASNRRIEEIRDLRDKVHVAPTTGKYKIYIIDEVHMLTREAFNALLKTLEEPPAHVIFILATTEAHKLPETIISRTQRFTFKPIDPVQAVGHLRSIAKQEKIDVNDDALQLIAEHSGGSFRDSISLLDQARSLGKNIEMTDIEQLLGLAPKQAVKRLYGAVCGGKAKDVVTALESLQDQGFQAASIAKQLAELLRDDLLDGKCPLEPSLATSLLGKLLETASAAESASYLELALLEPVLVRDYVPTSTLDEVMVEPIVDVEKVVKVTPEEPEPAKASKPQPAKAVAASGKSNASINEDWTAVLNSLKKHHNTLYGVVRMAEPVQEKDRLILKFAFPFHQKRLTEAKNQQILHDVIVEITGKTVKIESTVDKKAQPPAIEMVSPPEAPDPALDTISNIFGGAELLD